MARTHSEEISELHALVDDFAAEMKRKLTVQVYRGYSGWDDPNNLGGLHRSLRVHANREWHAQTGAQAVDIANLAAMVWHHRQRGKS